MAWNFKDDETLDRLYMMWGRLGWCNTVGEYGDDVDVERLIAETTHVGRYDSRLLGILMTWVKDYGDLIDKNRLLDFLDVSDSAVLGATLDIAMQYGCSEDYSFIIKKCQPVSPPEILAKGFDDLEFFIEDQKEYAKEEFLKWGFYHASLFFYTDCVRPLKWILEHNKNLKQRKAAA